MLRAHGSRGGYVHDEVGLNSRLDEIQAAVLRIKLRHLDAWNERRRANAARYRAAIREAGLVGTRRARRRSPRLSPLHGARPRARRAGRAPGGGGDRIAVYYPTALHEQPAFARWARGRLPEAERAAAEVLSVPVHPWLTDAEVERVAAALAAPARRFEPAMAWTTGRDARAASACGCDVRRARARCGAPARRRSGAR